MVEYLFRRNTVKETLRGSRRKVHRLLAQRGKEVPRDIVALANERYLNIELTDKARLTELAGDRSHQGILLEVGPYPYSDIDDVLALAERLGERPFLLLFDLLHGPQNIGLLLRTAEACGIHGVIVQDRRAPDITPHVVIYSAGAAEHLLIAQVTNLSRTIDHLKTHNIWIVGLDSSEEARSLGEVDLNIPLALVVGSEGQGLRRLVRDRCDFLLRIPMRGQIESLNAATAGAVALYAAWQARGYQGVNEG